MITADRCELIRTWHIVISGFTQKNGEPTGMHRIWQRLHSLYSQPDTHIALREWDSDWAKVAEMVRVSSVDNPRIMVAAYSWGAGHGFIELAKELGKRGRYIRYAVLADPVYCHPLWALRWTAMLDWRPITIPDNVHDVRWFFQKENRPRAYELQPGRKRVCKIRKGIEISGIPHSGMDDQPAFHNAVLTAAGEMAGT